MAATPGLGVTGNGVGVTTPLAHKLAQSGLVMKAGVGTNVIRAGIFYDGVTNIVTGAANMSYNVAAFTAALSRGATAGTVLLANDGTVNVVTTAAPASNSRIDIVYVWQREFSLDGVNSNPVIGVAQGTAAASPVAPSLAAFPGALELARITVPAGVTATNTGTTITQTAPFTATAGGVLPFRTSTERDAASVPAGTAGYVLGLNNLFIRGASFWFSIYERPYGEWTTNADGVPDSTALVTGSITVDSTKTTTNPAPTGISGGVRLAEVGVYQIHWSAALGAAATGRTYLALKQGTTVLARASVSTGEDQGSVSTLFYATAANTDVTVEVFKQTGGASNVTGRIRVLKVV